MEKVMSWLEGLAEPDWRECYSDSEVQETARQVLDLIDDLLKKQEAVVRCGECKHNARCEIAFGCNGNREWFCADGERRADDA